MPFSTGEPVPWFCGPTERTACFHFSSIAGHYVVLTLFGSLSRPECRRILDDFLQVRSRFDDRQVLFFGVSTDPGDEQRGLLRDLVPGMRFYRDFDAAISRLLRALPPSAVPAVRESPAPHGSEPPDGMAATQSAAQPADPDGRYRPFTLILDERLRVLAEIPFHQPELHVRRVLEVLDRQPTIGPPRRADVQAPVLVVPRIFEPELCRRLIRFYEERGGEDSGFMREENGRTVGIIDYGHKRRADCTIDDEEFRRACMHRIHDRLAPEIEKAFQFKATRMERYIVACYEAETGGHFRAHRDNTTRGTAHRRFAVSLHLNSEEYEGGDLRFPEFGPDLYRAPTGGAVVFSCSLLHEATPVTRGIRYVFLPFLYDEPAARIRAENARFLSGTVRHVDSSTRPAE